MFPALNKNNGGETLLYKWQQFIEGKFVPIDLHSSEKLFLFL